jgi:hypothetical protein
MPPLLALIASISARFATDSPLEGAGFEPSGPPATVPVSARYRASGWRFERDRPAPAVREGRSGATPRACRRAACARRSPSAKNHPANWPRQEVTDGAGR